MKKHLLVLCLVLCTALLLAGCGTAAVPGSSAAPAAPSSEQQLTTIWRIVANSNDLLLLAPCGENTGGDLVRVNTANVPLTTEGEAALTPGTLIEVTHGDSMQLTYPAHFDTVYSIRCLAYGFDDLCALYLQVLNDLWAKDNALNTDIEYVSVDLSGTSLPAAEQAAVAWAFAEQHGVQPLQMNMDQLIADGWLTEFSASTATYPSYRWDNGCLFSITEQPLEGVYHGLRPLKFTAAKWRSPLGAYGFADCTSAQSALGQWAEYTIGAEFIS